MTCVSQWGRVASSSLVLRHAHQIRMEVFSEGSREQRGHRELGAIIGEGKTLKS